MEAKQQLKVGGLYLVRHALSTQHVPKTAENSKVVASTVATEFYYGVTAPKGALITYAGSDYVTALAAQPFSMKVKPKVADIARRQAHIFLHETRFLYFVTGLIDPHSVLTAITDAP